MGAPAPTWPNRLPHRQNPKAALLPSPPPGRPASPNPFSSKPAGVGEEESFGKLQGGRAHGRRGRRSCRVVPRQLGSGHPGAARRQPAVRRHARRAPETARRSAAQAAGGLHRRH
ncbi:hypothetical protein PVAP13_3KG290200 [Panicum virgatum]|uniref:Uncharacterized protein n=1 Tax=Panicum virgatum TaxID=38727 RepID=A0A8T0UYY7_PANVG|nr:hypothetical protein PVAP13_3KG290200 [Panicum virgatum]